MTAYGQVTWRGQSLNISTKLFGQHDRPPLSSSIRFQLWSRISRNV